MVATAQEVYDMLINDYRIMSLDGQIMFYLGEVDLVVKQRDVVGNIMQEWLQNWLDHKGIEYDVNDNLQMPPDFYLDKNDHTKGMLEVKAFNRSAGPGFDIADFRMYAEELLDKPYVLDVDYLIFGYDMSDNGVVTIKDVWLKKVWEITRRMEKYAVNLQIKNGIIQKIRPGNWYSEGTMDYKIFESKEHFLSAIEETVFAEPRFHGTISQTWRDTFCRAYRQRYNQRIDIPRWYDIKDQYDLKTPRKRAALQESIDKLREKIDIDGIRLRDLERQARNENDAVKVSAINQKIEKLQSKIGKAEVKLHSQEEELRSL